MMVGADGKVTWTPKSPPGTREGVIVLVKDKGGDQCYHTFDLWVVAAGRAH